MSSPWVIVGCGYTGARLLRRLAKETQRVIATRRGQEGLAELRRAIGTARAELRAADLARPDTLDALIPSGAVVVCSAPPSETGTAGEEELARAAAGAGAERLVYVSSTGVYPPAAGAWVDEESPVGPTSEHGRRRLAAEEAILAAAGAAGLEAVSLRVAGIYGPGRGVHARMRAGTYRVLGGGDTHVSRVHVDDLVRAIVAAGTRPLVRSVYTVADDDPATSREVADDIAGILGMSPPPGLPIEKASPRARAMLGADRRVSNQRLKEELGVELEYPSFREGVRQALAEEGEGKG